MKELKLYVWENVLCDYTNGIMFAYAKNIDEARKLIGEKMGHECVDLELEPRKIQDNEGFYIYGGS